MIEQIITDFKVRGIELWAKDGRLHYKALKGTLNDDDINLLKEYKEELVKYFIDEQNIEFQIRTEKVLSCCKRNTQIENYMVKQGKDGEFQLYVEPAYLEYSNPEENGILREVCLQYEGKYAKGIDRQLFQEWIDVAEKAALHSVTNMLQQSEIFLNTEDKYSIKDIETKICTQKKLTKFLHKWINILLKENIIEKSGDLYRLNNKEYVCGDAEYYWNSLMQIEEKLHFGKEFVKYLVKSGMHLKELFSGEMKALELLFPQGKMETAIATYRDSMTSIILNHIAQKCILTVAKKKYNHVVKILEAGAGVGGTSNELIPQLAEYSVEYYYTDVSNYFLNNAQNRFEKYPWVKYKLFDINKEYRQQGFNEKQFDIILCANVLHNAQNGPKVMEQLRDLLIPGGILVILDETKEPYFLLSSIGFNEGLSNFDDFRKENNSIFFERYQWNQMFDEIGAETIYEFPKEDDVIAKAGQTIFVVRSVKRKQTLTSQSILEYLREKMEQTALPDKIQICKSLLKIKEDTKDYEVSENSLNNKNNECIYEEPCTEMEVAIANIWSEVLNKERIGRNENFFMAGGDSLLISQVISKMWDKIPESKAMEWGDLMKEIIQTPTVSEISEKLVNKKKKMIETPLNWLSHKREGIKGKKYTVLIHAGTGTLTPYRELINYLLNDKEEHEEIIGIVIPDRKDYLNIPYDRLFRYAGMKYANTLLKEEAESYKLIGHCVGGLVALEIARCLQENGKQVELVLISSNLVKNNVENKEEYLELCQDVFLEKVFGRLIGADVTEAGYVVEDDVLQNVIKDIKKKNNGTFDVQKLEQLDEKYIQVKDAYKELLSLTHHQRLNRLYTTLPQKEKPIEEQQEKVMDELYEVFKHNFIAAIYYNPVPYSGKATVLKCRCEAQNFFVNTLGIFSDALELWEQYLGNLRFSMIEGEHLSCLEEPAVGNNYGKIVVVE